MKVFRQYYQKPIPSDAVIKEAKNGVKTAIYRGSDGRRTSSPLTRDGKKLSVQSKTWSVRIKDGSGRTRVMSTGCVNKEEARRVANELNKLAERERAGVLTPRERRAATARREPIEQHVNDYLAALSTKRLRGRLVSREHVANSRRILRQLSADLSLTTLGCLDARRLDDWISRELEAELLAPRSIASRVATAKAFTAWLTREGTLIEDPFLRVQKPSQEPRRRPRAFSPAELTSLFQAACSRPLAEAGRPTQRFAKGRKGWCKPRVTPSNIRQFIESAAVQALPHEERARLQSLGRERALAYRILVSTGLRTGELKALRVRDVDVDARCMFLPADADKAGKNRVIPLRDDVAEEIRAYLQERQWQGAQNGEDCIPFPGTEPLIRVPVAQVFDADLVAAGIEKLDERGHAAVLHSLRHTHATLHAGAGSSLRLAQAAMRHSDPRLTATRYTDEKFLDVRKANARLAIPPAWGGGGEDSDSRLQRVGALLDELTQLLTDHIDPDGDMARHAATVRRRIDEARIIKKSC